MFTFNWYDLEKIAFHINEKYMFDHDANVVKKLDHTKLDTILTKKF